MVRIACRCFRRIVLVGAIFALVALAVLVTLGRVYLPRLGEYQPVIAETIHQRLGLRVEFSSLRGEWRGLMPMVTLKGVTMQNEQAVTIFEAEHVAVSLGLFRSLLLRRPIPRAVSVVKPQLLLARSDSGRWGLLGVPLGKGATPSGRVLSRFLDSIDVLEFSQVSASVRVAGRTERLLDSANLILRQGLFLSQLSLKWFQRPSLPVAQARPALHLRAEFTGGVFDAERITAYLALDRADFMALSPLFANWPGLPPRSLSGDLWYEWSRSDSWALQGSLRGLHWEVSDVLGRDVLPLSSAGVTLFAEGSANGSVAGRFTGLQAQWGDVTYGISSGTFDLSASRSFATLALSSLDVSSVVKGLRDNALGARATTDEPAPRGSPENRALLPPALDELLATLRPSGWLHDVHVRLPLTHQARSEFSLVARAQAVQFSAWHAVPAVAAIDGVLSMGIDSGFFALDGSSLSLSFPKILSHEMPFEHLAGRINWRIEGDLEVSSELLSAQGDFGEASAAFTLAVPLRQRQARAAQLTFELGVQHSQVAYIERFTPHLLPAGLRSWMRQSIHAGDISRVGFIYHGSLRKSQPAERTVQLFAEVSDGRLRYLPQWPELTRLDARVLLSGRTLLASARQAGVLGSTLRDITLHLEPGENGHLLSCASELSGPARDLLALFTDTPLAKVGADVARSWRAQGAYSARLQVVLPLHGGSLPTVDVRGRLHDVDLEHAASGLLLARSNGALSYSSARGLRAKSLRAQLWGQPVRASIAPGPASVRGYRPLRLQARAPLAVSSIGDWAGTPTKGLAAGVSDWTATLDVHVARAGQASSIRFGSDLKGVELNLPQPFAKSREQSRKVEVQFALAAGAGLSRGQLSYANMVNAWFDGGRPALRAAVVLGGTAARPSLPKQGVVVSGQLPRLVVREWLEAFAGYPQSASARSRPRSMPPLRVDRLRLLEVDLFGQVLRRPLVNLAGVNRHWQLSLSHPRLAGTVRLPVGKQRYRFDIDHLRLPLDDSPGHRAVPGSSALSTVDPGSLPNAEVRIRDLQLGRHALGHWAFETVPEPGRLRVKDLRVRLGDTRLTASASRRAGASLSWSRSGDRHRTRFTGKLRAGDLDQLLSQFGYDAGIVSEQASLGFDLQWPGPPDEVNWSVIAGDVALQFEHGQLRQTSGTPAEALRVLGILNVNYLARRLRLDFSDLYKSGLSYDSIDGVLRLDKGRMHWQRPLEVAGPSSQLTLRGDFDLLREKIDAELVVSLPLTSNLPWMVALTLPGGIPIAAGVYVAGRVFEQQLESLTSAVYQISGTLDEPEVKFKHLADAGEGAMSAPPNVESTLRARRERSGARR